MNGASPVLETPVGHAAAADRELELAVQQLRNACAQDPSGQVAATVVAAAPLEPRLAELLQLPPSSGLVSAAVHFPAAAGARVFWY